MENKRKLIAIDLDGTLLNSECLLLPYSRKILSTLSDMGHIIVLHSGRPWRSMKGFYEEIGLKSPAIVYNGAYVFNPTDKDFPELKLSFDMDAVREFYDSIKNIATSFMCEDDKTIYVKKIDMFLDHFFWYKGMDVKVGDITSILDVNPMTCILKTAHKYDKRVQKIVTKYDHLNIGLRHWTASLYSELYLKHASKEEALLYVMKQLGIDKEDVYCFGDSDNDYGILSVSGHPYTMKNGKSKLLQVTFQNTEYTNNEDGVAKELAKIFSL